jgi:hypothetical protein
MFLFYLQPPSITQTIQYEMIEWTVNNEFERMWKVIVAQFKVL